MSSMSRHVAHRRSLARLVATAALAHGLAGVARADDAAVREAQKRFQEGLPLMDAGKFEEARLKFIQAVAVLKAPPLFYNLASSEERTGHDVDAVRHFRAFLKAGADDARVTDAMRDKARANIATLMQKLGQLAIDVPEGATVTIDGAPHEGTFEEAIPVTPGKHTVEAGFGGRVRSTIVQAQVGTITPVPFSLEQASLPPTTTPPPAPSVPLERTTMGYALPIGAAALGVVSAGVGIGVLVHSNVLTDETNDFNRESTGGNACSGASTTDRCTSFGVKSDAATQSRTIGWVTLIGGGAFVGGAALLWVLLAPKSTNGERRVGADAHPAASRPRAVPLLGPVVGVAGTF